MNKQLGICIVGTGKIALANHLPGIALSGWAKVVALCDSDRAALEAASHETGVTRTFTDFRHAVGDEAVDAVIVATPNFTHLEIVKACATAKKHVLCEKPLALNLSDATAMWLACERANVRHMTAFTYRFVPAMRWMHHLVSRGDIGRPVHFRAVRFQDWGDRPLGWRQVQKLAGTGELADMLSHRIDYGHLLVGRMKRLSASMKTIVPARGGKPSDVDDWVAMLADFDGDATGVLESTKLATGRGEGYGGRDDVEINGTEGSIVYSTQSPLELKIARRGGADLKVVQVPKEFLVWPGSARDPQQGDPRVTFRYDQNVEFIAAILEQRPCRPTLREGADCQAVMDACVVSSNERRWVDVKYPEEA